MGKDSDGTTSPHGLPPKMTMLRTIRCGEPLNPELHCIASRVLCPNFINSYWSTEHGAICLSHPYGNAEAPLRRDAHMRPMPWVQAQVWLPLNPEPPHKFVIAQPIASEFGGGSKKGRLVIMQP